ncbi:MAG: hypothetical protein KC502_06610 [Myxococcales bacterium]|nr:hypothetical protein [Myxococcales bacterium]
MNTRSLVTTGLICFFIAACGGAPAKSGEAQTEDAKPKISKSPDKSAIKASSGPQVTATASTVEMAPPPFSAAQIQAATKPGRTYLFRLSVPAKLPKPVLRQLRFTHVHAKGGMLTNATLTTDGKPRGAASHRPFIWTDLVQHATWPKRKTTITEATLTVPAGTFKCRKYLVRHADGHTVTAWFATALPGAPIRHLLEKAGKPLSEMVLIRHTPGNR